ncbi:MAG: ATP-grasp domain-containing protein [Phycisphaeraceae bacterium]
MRVLAIEHLCAGALLGQVFEESLVRQGRAMLSAVLTDLRAADHEVVTILDGRLELTIGNVEVHTVYPADEPTVIFDRMVGEVDTTLVIAPETGDVLRDWMLRLERRNAPSLNSSSAAVLLCGDKLATSRHLTAAGVPTPMTVAADGWHTLGDQERYVIKPRQGAGCEHTFVCLRQDVEPLLAAGGDPRCTIVQPWVAGLAASVSAIVGRDGPRLLPAGEQTVTVDGQKMNYRGGRLPLEAALSRRAHDLAARAVAAVPGLAGWVGVDLVLGDEPAHDAVIEINTRMTLSYIGLRQLLEPGGNLAQALLDPAAPLSFAPGTVRFDAMGRCQLESCA